MVGMRLQFYTDFHDKFEVGGAEFCTRVVKFPCIYTHYTSYRMCMYKILVYLEPPPDKEHILPPYPLHLNWTA